MPFCDAEGWTVFSESRPMDFTLCFQDSVLTLIPSVILLIFITPRINKVIGKGRLEGVKASPLFHLKMLLVLAAVGIQVAFLAELVSESNYLSSALLSTVLYLVGLIAAAALHYFEYFNIANPSAGLLIFWLFTALISIFPTRSWIEITPNGLSSPLPLLKLLFTIVSFLIFILENIPKPKRESLKRHDALPIDQKNPSPEPRSNYFVRVTFFWLVPLLEKGKKKALKMDDLFDLNPKLLSYPLYLTTKAKMDADEAIKLQAIKDEETKGINEEDSKIKRGGINLFGTLAYTAGYSFLAAIFPRILYIAAYYVRPILFSDLISFISTYSSTSLSQGIAPEPAWVGFGLLIAVFASGTLATIFNNQYVFICYNASIKTRGVLINLIYRKSLRLSSTDKQEGMGSIVNHMSTDVDNIMQFFNIAHYSWSSIVELIITAIMLYNEVRYAMFASIGAAFVIVLCAGLASPQIAKANKAMMARSDHRLKLVTELVTYIKSVKLYAWEKYFAGKINKAREDQIVELRRFYSWLTVLVSFGNSIIPFCIFSTLAAYSGIATEDEPLDTRRIFVTITLINMLQEPIGYVMGSANTIFTGIVSYGRLRDFLNSEEINSENVLRNPDAASSDVAYEVTDGTFGWYSPSAIKALAEKKEKEAAAKAEAEAKEKALAEKKKKSGKKTDEETESGEKGDKAELDEEDEKDTTKVLDEKKDDSESVPDGSRDNTGPVLHNISFSIKRGSLSLVVGRVGEGKSSLVGALLGEMHKYSGTVRSFGSLAYVSQSAWILNDTVRNNILFGRPYDKQRYLETIRACALTPDFKMLVSGDKTVIGEKGINLSGGQKQRISIARAVYANADVYIFDDPLSAVDAHVDEHIFKNVFKSILASKTRILITNGVNHLKDADQIILIKQGRISQDGHYEELIQNEGGDLFRLVQESKLVASKEEDEKEGDEKESITEGEDDLEEGEESNTEHSGDEDAVDTTAEKPDMVKRPSFKRNKSSGVKEDFVELDEKDEVDEEVIAKGNVGWPVYKYYLSSIGLFSISMLVLASACMVGIQVGTQLWQGHWGKSNDITAAESAIAGAPVQPEHSTGYWVATYFAWSISFTLVLALLSGVSLIYLSLRASKTLHSAMVSPLMRSPMSFFDVTSSGKIVNRFSHDITAVDTQLPVTFIHGLVTMFSAATIFGMCIAASPYFAIIMLPLSVAYYYLGGYFLVSNRELKRLDSAARSPLYAHFSETLAGLTVIRAFGDSSRFAVDAMGLLDRSQQTSYLINVSTRWLQIVLDFLSVIVLTSVGLLAILTRHSANQQVFSIVLSNIGSLTLMMSDVLTCACTLETLIVSVERIREYINLQPEARDYIPDSKTDEAWPQRGQITFSQYSTRYREGLDLVLKDINVTINGGERVGIVGRTGAGKSSVTLALFRIVEAAKGSITIDGIDISTLGLHELRSHLTIIPQDPFLFGDSIRVNLDPFNKHTDAEIWAALESASLKSYVQTLPEGISSTIDNGGENMSLGQRQLMSLARAMLAQNTRVLCLDEATAAIDVETDNAIQRALRREFAGCTVLTIAHRINTIMDSDRILVLEKGEVAEYDSPENLLQKKDSIFFSLANKSGNA
ncbi:hypothetical protein BGZ80_007654 [Entomortierella chlamydospora]|uniref:P-loop containing nucleoside triphosphate hydrolase protein n=1 Tax=Entomortierella chlamydospora TaxID=101097 RepID=A0A9P6MYX8_9FUNG|nr:hypothetical protein BGZ79_008851 [Entomortierella chlamydospora]KAG0018010.1 hypothetical protein BGZ80_007654 [Entomortierella chlamydospora]